MGCGVFMITKLKDLSIGDIGIVVGYTHNSVYRKRLLSMGFTPGTKFEVVRLAPMGDPMEIKIRNSHVTLRLDEASILIVELQSPLCNQM